ncbi:MAG: arginyltransferase [Methylotenera sp.]|nr:MAG: arginyltransferase [Methylotenera sp.]PPD17491.1 MAG: arginyltransferase [Methylotenera sp.]
MSLPNEQPLHKLQFYVTTPYKCGYLPNKLAQSLIASPQHLIDANIYNGLITQGFRRSGKFAYRPHCENCRACIAVRLVLSEFTPTRSQKRAHKQHSDLTAQILPLHFNQQHFELYESYQSLRHNDETTSDTRTTAKDEAEQYRQFLCKSNVESLMIEFKDANNQVKIVSVVDILNDGVSAVYTFYNALEPKASYGTYSIMWLAEWTKSLNLPYLYLGYWIKDSQKMAYKQQFKSQQKLIDGEWI